MNLALKTLGVVVLATIPSIAMIPSQPSLALLAAIGVVHVGAFLLTKELLSYSLRPGRVVFLIFVYVWYGLAPLASLSLGVFPGGSHYSETTAIQVFMVVLTGLVGFEAGYRRKSPRIPVGRSKDSSASWRRYLLVVISLLAWLRLGGWDLTFASRIDAANSLAALDGTDHRNLNRAGSAVLIALARVPPAYLLVTHLLRHRTAPGSLRSLTTISLIVLNLVVSSPLSTPRQWVGGVVVASLLAASKRVVHQRLALASLIPVLVFLFPVANVFRSTVSEDVDIRVESPVSALTERFDFDVFATTADTLTTVENSGHTFGSQISGAALFWIPRAIWVDKPVYSGRIIFAESPTNRSPHDNMSVSLWAEGYLDLGLLGSFGLLFLFGVATRRTDSRLCGLSNDWRTARSLLLVGYSLVVIRGPLLPAGVTIAAIFAVAWFIQFGQEYEQRPERSDNVGNYLVRRRTRPHWQYAGRPVTGST